MPTNPKPDGYALRGLDGKWETTNGKSLAVYRRERDAGRTRAHRMNSINAPPVEVVPVWLSTEPPRDEEIDQLHQISIDVMRERDEAIADRQRADYATRRAVERAERAEAALRQTEEQGVRG